MEWFENDEIMEIAQTMARFGKNEITGKVVNPDHPGRPDFPRQALNRLSDMGFLRGVAGEENGGMAMSPIMAVVVLSKLAEASAGFAAIMAAHYAAMQALESVPGGREILAAIPSNSIVGVSLCDDIIVTGEALRKERRDGSRSICFPSPVISDYTLVRGVYKGTAALYLPGRKDLKDCRIEEMPLSGCEEMFPAWLIFSADRLGSMKPVAVGREAGDAYGMVVSLVKFYFSAIMQGNARAASAYALKYTTERFQTGRMIIEHQNVRRKIVEMEVKNQAMASFVYRAAHAECGYQGYNLYDMLFDFVGTEAENVCNEALQSLGGYGYMREYGLEKRLRDVKTLQAMVPAKLTDWLGIRQDPVTA